MVDLEAACSESSGSVHYSSVDEQADEVWEEPSEDESVENVIMREIVNDRLLNGWESSESEIEDFHALEENFATDGDDKVTIARKPQSATAQWMEMAALNMQKHSTPKLDKPSIATAAAALMTNPAAVQALTEIRKREMNKYLESLNVQAGIRSAAAAAANGPVVMAPSSRAQIARKPSVLQTANRITTTAYSPQVPLPPILQNNSLVPQVTITPPLRKPKLDKELFSMLNPHYLTTPSSPIHNTPAPPAHHQKIHTFRKSQTRIQKSHTTSQPHLKKMQRNKKLQNTMLHAGHDYLQTSPMLVPSRSDCDFAHGLGVEIGVIDTLPLLSCLDS